MTAKCAKDIVRYQKIISKTRIGATIMKTYESCRTPYERLLESPYISQTTKQLVMKQHEQLSIIELKQNLDKAIRNLISVHKTKRKLALEDDKPGTAW